MKYSNLKVGDKIKILSQPKYWCSHYNMNDPISARLTYPYEGIVELLQSNDDAGYRAMLLGGFSWDLTELNLIVINQADYEIF